MIEKVTLGAVTSWKHYISAGSGPVAVYTRKSGAPDEMHYLTRDHLGSVDSVTNASGDVEVRLSYSAFGQRRKEAGWSGTPPPADWTEITDTTRRGFTFHEMLDNLSLTHMNGRVYDPVVGRFLSADPFVQAPGFTQSFNRYSYTANNPLAFIDPSGYSRVPNPNQYLKRDSPQELPEGVLEGITVTGSRSHDWSGDWLAALIASLMRQQGDVFDGASSEGGGAGEGESKPEAPQEEPQEVVTCVSPVGAGPDPVTRPVGVASGGIPIYIYTPRQDANGSNGTSGSSPTDNAITVGGASGLVGGALTGGARGFVIGTTVGVLEGKVAVDALAGVWTVAHSTYGGTVAGATVGAAAGMVVGIVGGTLVYVATREGCFEGGGGR